MKEYLFRCFDLSGRNCVHEETISLDSDLLAIQFAYDKFHDDYFGIMIFRSSFGHFVRVAKIY